MSSTPGLAVDTSAPKDSPPSAAAATTPSDEQTKPLKTPQSPTIGDFRPAQTQEAIQATNIDAPEDSEAETEILSQEHKEDGANGTVIKNEHSEDTSMIDAPAAGDRSLKSRGEDVGGSNGSKGGSGRRRESETDGDRAKSRLSSQRTSPASITQSSSRRKSSSIDAPTPEVKKGGNEYTSPAPPSSRKRKARDDTSPGDKRESEPPRQRYKTDRHETNASRTSRERSPSPRKNPHRRTGSSQAPLPNGQAHPKKRKPPALSSARLASYQEEWDSESSSDATTRRHIQAKRSSHRSVSTPGRAMAARRKAKDRYGMTPFATACQEGDLERARETLKEDRSVLDEPDNDGNTPLQSAALAGQDHIVEFLLAQRSNIHTTNRLQETPLIDAVENGRLEVVRLLLDAGVDPSRPNKKGRQPIDLVPKPDMNDSEEVARVKEIANLLKAAIARNHGSNRTPRLEQPEINQDENRKRKDLDFLDRTTKNLRGLVEENDQYGVSVFLDSRVRVDNSCLVAAARSGHIDMMNVLIPMVDSDKTDFHKPLVAAIGRGNLDIIELLLKQDLDPTQKTSDGKFYWQVAEETQGPNWESERNILKAAFDEARSDKKRPKGSPESKTKIGSATKRDRVNKLSRGSSSPLSLKRRSSTSPSMQRPSNPENIKKRRLVRGKDRDLSQNGASSTGQKRVRRIVNDDEDDSEDEDDVKSSPGTHRPAKVTKRSLSPNSHRKERHTSEPATSADSKGRKSSASDLTRNQNKGASRIGSGLGSQQNRMRARDDRGRNQEHTPPVWTTAPPVRASANNQSQAKTSTQSRVQDHNLPAKLSSQDRGKENGDSDHIVPVPAEKEAKEKQAKEAAAEKERQAQLATEREAAEKEKEKERLAKEAADRQREQELKEKERLAREAAEKERLAKEAAEREAAERRKAEEEEEARKRAQAEAEAAAAAERARIEAEEKAKREEEERQQRVRERQARLSRLPKAFNVYCHLGNALPIFRTKFRDDTEPGAIHRFASPLIGIKGREIGFEEGSEDAQNMWLLAPQAFCLLGMPEVDPSLMPETASWATRPVTVEQREALWFWVQQRHKMHYPYPKGQLSTEERDAVATEGQRHTEQWAACEDLVWIRFSDWDTLARKPGSRINYRGVRFEIDIPTTELQHQKVLHVEQWFGDHDNIMQ
ncbi:MAG: Set3 complex subunit with deacetylase activity, meiotic-specific repressor of sporulation proteins [Bogoriella megaspora]|nr:MAG: Set3 complex subunit with deacetylase activity, meiotic-specific repressor of sporulation proteins [Bogoriella megaspora]